MAIIIKMRELVQDNWRLLEGGADGALPEVPADGDIIVPLALWQARRDKLLAHPGRVGLWLDSHEGPEAVADDLAGFGLIAINFPKFTDGRGYTMARLLRDRYGYRGELRAIGDVQRDQLHYLARCGFDAFALKDGQDGRAALSAFADFSEAYQNSVERPQPLFRRRWAIAGEGMEWS
ncbi:MAG: DUF934 domain-containing protein [Betaproteobacteria bacterium]|nr:DUF934 domain-containing protein [Betaproteobacteria bacterium]